MNQHFTSESFSSSSFVARSARGAAPAVEVLLVDHERDHLAVTADFLMRQGYRAWLASDAETAHGIASGNDLDLMILGDLPSICGLDLSRELMLVQPAPIIVLSDQVDELDRILALELGADDLLTRKGNPRVLLARARALLRRSPGRAGRRVAAWRLDRRKRLLATPDGASISLTGLECALLAALSEEPARTVGGQAAAHLFCGGAPRDPGSALRTAITRLRRKIGDEGAQLIRTVSGRGYCLARPLQVC